jgi:hypothetical protein
MTPEVCPKCGKPVPVQASTPVESCPACGVIFAKLQPPPVPGGLGEPGPLPGRLGVRQPIEVMKIPQYDREFSWAVAFVHSILLCGLIAVFGIGLTVIQLIPEIDVVGPLWRLAALLFLLGLGVSRGFQLGKGAVLLSSLGAIVLLLGVVVYLMRTIQLPSLDASFRPQELREMEVRPPRICHPALGVSFPEPGPSFHPNPEFQKQLNRDVKRPSVHHIWAFSGREGLVIAHVAKGVGQSPISLKVFARGLRKSALKPPEGPPKSLEDTLQQKARVVTERYSEVEGRPAYHLAVDYPKGAQMDVRCLASGPDREPPIIFCLEGGGDSRLFFQPMLGGMALRGCEG